MPRPLTAVEGITNIGCVDPALAALLGAVVGGGAVAGTDLLLERSRTRRKGRRMQIALVAKHDAPLGSFYEELLGARRLIGRAIERDIYMWDPPKRQLPAISWGAHQGTLAAEAPDETWRAVADAYGELDRLNWQVIYEREEDDYLGEPPENPFEGRKVGPAARIQDAAAVVDDAIERLLPLTK